MFAIVCSPCFLLFYLVNSSSFSNMIISNFCQCVCDWDDRDKMFVEVEGILRRQIKVLRICLICQ